MSGSESRVRYTDTLPPDALSPELAPVVDQLGLREHCRQLAMEGWTVIERPVIVWSDGAAWNKQSLANSGLSHIVQFSRKSAHLHGIEKEGSDMRPP